MLKITILIVALAAFVWYLYTKDVTSLELSQDKITIALNQKSTSINVQQIEAKSLSFQTLQVNQKILERRDGSLLVWEESETDGQYQYNDPAPKSVQMILDAKKMTLWFQTGSLYCAQAILKSDEVLNVIFRQGDDQSLTLLYGLSDMEFLEIIKRLKPSKVPLESSIVHDVLRLDNPKYATQTKWSTRLHAIDGLITPVDYE